MHWLAKSSNMLWAAATLCFYDFFQEGELLPLALQYLTILVGVM